MPNARDEWLLDEYRGHICATTEPGCSCARHATALREVKRLTAEVRALREAGDRMADVLERHELPLPDDRFPTREDCRAALEGWLALPPTTGE